MPDQCSYPNRCPAELPDMARLQKILIRHEGRQTHPYRDIFGKVTISVGYDFCYHGLKADEIDLLLANVVATSHAICVDLCGAAFTSATLARQKALLSMVFNLGGPRLTSFRRIRAAILDDIWLQAASEALQSRWARQVGHR